MQETKKGNCNYLVCCKVDWLGRNIAELANLVEIMNKLDVFYQHYGKNFFRKGEMPLWAV